MNPNRFGNAMLFGLFAVAYFYHLRWGRRFGIRKLLCLGAAIVLALFVAPTGSRQNLLLIVLFTVLLILFCYRQRFLRSWRVAASVVVISAILCGVVAYNLREGTLMAQRVDLTVREGESAGRMQLIRDGLSVFTKRPFIGAGLGNFQAATGATHYAHNDYVELLVTTGLLGFVIYCLALVTLWRRLRTARRGSQDEKVAVVIGVCRACFVGPADSRYVRCFVSAASSLAYVGWVCRVLAPDEA